MPESLTDSTPLHADAALSERERIERAICGALPALLVAEYGETERDWTELHSVRRIARALAAEVSAPTRDSSQESDHG